jgi:hypothetical protein
MWGLKKIGICGMAAAVLVLAACSSENVAALEPAGSLKDPPIITSATHQHTLYNGRGQPIETASAKDDAPAPVVTYFPSEENLLRNEGGSTEAPGAVGDYFVRIERPAGNGYRQGPDIKVEYHIQKALVAIRAEDKQEYNYDGNPKPAAASVDTPVELSFAYYPLAANAADPPLPGPPVGRGVYRVRISYPGGANYMGASKEVELTIK